MQRADARADSTISGAAMPATAMSRSPSPGTRAACCALAALCLCDARAQPIPASYPARPIRLIVPFAASGAGDFVARPLSARLGEALGQQFVIDNRPGAGGVLGADIAAKAPADGYTLALVATAHAVNPSLMPRLPFDTVRDFAPVTLVVESPLILLAHPSVPVAGVRELIALAAAQPGRVTYGSAGAGTGGHLAMALLGHMTGVTLLHIPYKGAGPALTDLLG
jgi:tripartite-type tricarboxylate transporter receptor subunit TctC